MSTSEVPIEGVGLRFASACVRTLGGTGRSLLALVSEFMRERDVPTLRCLHAALMDPANAKHAEFWRGLNISVALASWLGDPDDACRQLANDWIRDLKGTPEHAQHALLEALSERDQPVDAVRTRRLADLSLTKATQSQLEDFLPSLWTALVCDTGTNDKPVDPGRIELLTHLLGKRLLATPSLILLASALPSPEWLAAVVTFHRDAPSVLHSAGREAMKNMLALAAQERPNWLLRVAHAGATHGWIDAQMGNELLGLPCKGNPSAYGGALAHQSAFPAGGEKALHTIKALHAAGADLDTVAKIDDAILVGRSVQEAQKFVYPLTWKGTLLHAAIEGGTPAMVAALLRLGCDPTRKLTIEDARGVRQVSDCYVLFAQLRTPNATGEQAQREAAIGDILHAWRAQLHSQKVIERLKVTVLDHRKLAIGAMH